MENICIAGENKIEEFNVGDEVMYQGEESVIVVKTSPEHYIVEYSGGWDYDAKIPKDYIPKRHKTFNYAGSIKLELIKKSTKKTFMNKVSIMMKKLLDADTQTLVKAGFINGDLELTCEGAKNLQTIMFMANKAEMVTVAEALIAEAEAEAKK